MKNKPTRHKELNTFKFQPFSERIANIDVDIFHKVGHEYENESEETECYFYQAVENWSILNLTESFDAFKREIKPHMLITLPQLVLEKDRVVEVLLKHLKLKNPLCLQPLLDLVVAVAKDLRKDFYPYYKDFLEILIDLLNTKDTELLEWTFTSLAYLFKFLWRPLLKDIVTVFNTLLPLLSDNKPDYINNFAAGSFAFVARKVKDRQTFLSHIIKTVKSRKDGVEGCGRLLFEVIHGVSGQFHSCAEVILPFLLQSLTNGKFHQGTLYEILEQVVTNIVLNIQPQKGDLLWNSLIEVLTNLENDWKGNSNEETARNIELVLKLLGQSIEHRNGKFLQNPVPVIQSVIRILSIETLPESVLLTAVQIGILLLLSRNVKLSQEQASAITRKILSLSQVPILLYFVENVSDFSSFEALVLPTFLKQCVETDLSDDFLRVLTHLVLKKSPPSGSGVNLNNWAKYSLDFNSKDNSLKMEKIFTEYLSVENFEKYFASLICLPHMNLSTLEKIAEILCGNIGKLLDQVDKKEESNIKRLLFTLNCSVECIIHLGQIQGLIDQFNRIIDVLLPLSRNEEFICALKTVDLLITVLKDDNSIIHDSNLDKLNQILAPNFASPYHEVRLITAHLYTFFENLPQFDLRHSTDPEVPKEKFAVFSIFYRVESIDPQVHTYRDQVQGLEKLNFDKPQMLMCNQTAFKDLPLRYLCGALYMNFKLLWEPVMKIIQTHAHGLGMNEFWAVYGEELKGVVANIREERSPQVEAIPCKWEFLGDLYQEFQKLKAKPDFFNYRLLLWKTMVEFADIAEAKTRDVSELFLDFIDKEYTKSNSDVAATWNIKQNCDGTDEVREVEGVEEEVEAMPLQVKRTGKANMQALMNFLPIFSKIRSPKSMYRESELNKLYFDLLQHKNADIQKLALDCIMTYKHKFLTPYKGNLYNLIDEKNFKNEIATFRIDKESAILQVEHREDLIPFIMRIVFSKMSGKAGMRTGGKAAGQHRRGLVLRFLAGCEEEEMLTFVQMALRYYSKFLSEDAEVMVESIAKNVDLEKFIPPKRLMSSLNLISVIVDQFGGLMGNPLLTFILQIVLVIGAAVKGAFDQALNVHAGYLAILRSLRTSTIKIVERFFQQFDRYPWNNKQINAIFNTFVWPYLDRLNIEGIHSPTTLLKLFVQWGSNPRYFSLLVKHETGNEEKFVLPHVIDLLLNDKSHVTVVNIIEEMIEKLLSLQADEEDLQLVIPVDNLKPIAQHILDRVKLDDKLNYGSCLLLPHIPAVLEKLKRKLGKTKNLNQRELFIMARISELVWEADISDETLKLLLPIVLKRCSASIGEEIVNQYLTTILNLVGNVENPAVHLRQISSLFGEIGYASSRRLLVKILKATCTSGELKTAPSLIDGLNAWDAKWVDQPDFQRRHDTFKDIQTKLDQIDLDLGILLIHNCYFLLKSEKDLSLRESSSHCLKQVCPILIKRVKPGKDLDYLLNDTIFALIRSGMKSKNDDFRNECICLLGHLSRECPESHMVFRDLNRYTNKLDLEVDFFENITHLQLHRHARALLKFTQISKTLTTSPNIRTLTQFILPLASFYLCNDRYSGKNSVIDAAIACIGTICRILPWHQYEGLLKYYLSQLRRSVDHQKQLVRIIVTILDSFHFDLHKAQLSQLEEKKSEQVEDTVEEEKSEELEVDEALDLEPASEESEDDEEVEDVVVEVKVCEKITVLCKSTATRVTTTIQSVLLPQLHKALAEMTHHDTSHKVNRKKTGVEREEEDLLRVPISLALVKLLQRLPKEILDANLPGIFMKLCTFLKSRLESVRRVTRETLQTIMKTLGPDYLHVLLGEMRPLLNRGFHVHVLVFTTHAVLSCLKESYKPTDLDKILLTVLQLCQADLFGSLSEEKEVAKIAVKTSEAKSTKSFDTFQILAQFITDKCLMDLLIPIKNVLQSSHSYKTVHKAQECLRHIALGLVDNTFICTDSLLKFAYGTASESIPELISGKQKRELSEKEREKLKRARPDCFIIPKAPVGRSGVRISNVKSSLKTNAHLLIEFGLRLCHVMLKRDRLKDEDYKPYLDPFVVIFKNCLNSKHVKLSTLTLQCLSWVMKYELPSLEEHVAAIAEDMFAILHKYAAAGLSKGDNFDLVVAVFRTMAVLVRDVKYHTINTDQLKILLLYAEQDMYDHERQATAFNLLKAIIARKLIVPEIHEIMIKVAELSITSELNHVRLQARLVFHQYLMNYPLGNKLEKLLTFFISQLSYEMQYGRESAIEMISSLITSFPINVLKEHSGTLLVTLGTRLVNDEVPECRKMVANCLSTMLNRLERNDRDPLFDVVAVWLRDKKLSHRQLGAQLCGIFISIEKDTFETRLPKLIPQILKQFGLEAKKSNRPLRKETPLDEEEERIKDHHIFQVLQMLLKMCAHCPSFLKCPEIEVLARHIQTLLAYPHDWVRLAAAQFLGFVLATTDIEELATLVANNTSGGSGYLQKDPVKAVKSLTLDLCDQLQPGTIKEDLAEQVIKNLVFIARVLKDMPIKEHDAKTINMLWLTKRMRKIVNTEVVATASSTVLRTEVFKWIAGVATVLEVDNIMPIFNHLLAPLVREMITTEESNAPLRQLAKEVATIFKKKVGIDVYTSALSSVQQILSVKRAERKRARKQLAVTDVELFAKKKIKRQEKKKEAKKRKIADLKGRKNFKRRKVVDLDVAEEVM